MDKQFSEMKPTQGLKEERPSEAEQALSEVSRTEQHSSKSTCMTNRRDTYVSFVKLWMDKKYSDVKVTLSLKEK